MQVEHLDQPGQLQRVLLAEARDFSRALAQAEGGCADRVQRLRQQLCNRLNLLALVVSEGRILPGAGAGRPDAPGA